MPARDREDNRQIMALPGDVSMPQDVAAERSVLSAMILSEDVLHECLTKLRPDDFYLLANRTIYLAITEMFEHSEPVDPISLADHLRSMGELERIGGESYLLELGSNSLALASWRHHVEMLRREAGDSHILTRNNYERCLCTGLLYDPMEHIKIDIK